MTLGSSTRILLSETQVKKLIPHREPFLLVRHVIENVIGGRVTAVAMQNDKLDIPRRLLLLEGMGQTSALLIRQMPIYENKPIPVFAGMRDVCWMTTEHSKGVVLYTAKLARAARAKFGVIEAHAHIGDQTLCSGKLTFSFYEQK